MHYLEVPPHPTLSNYVDAYWTATGSSMKQTVEKILPDGCVDIIFNLGNDCYTDNGTVLMKPEKAYLIGPMTKYKETAMDNQTRLLGIRFKPGAVSAFFKFAALCEITNQTIPLENILCFDLRRLIKSPFELLDHELSRNLGNPNLHLLMQIQTIEKSKGRIAMEELASIHCTTVRQLERNFKEHLGIAPKGFANLVRYQHAMNAIANRKSGEAIVSIAHDFGYYDHAHLTNDFKKYQGCGPTSV